MKITIDIAKPLHREARELARREGTTVHALVEHGLRQALPQKRRNTPFRLRDASFAGDGLRPELDGAPVDRWLEMAREGRGG